MHYNHDHAETQLRNELLDQLNRDRAITALRDGLIETITDTDDPINHPTNYRDASIEQQAAIRAILLAISVYIEASTLDEWAVSLRVDQVRSESAA